MNKKTKAITTELIKELNGALFIVAVFSFVTNFVPAVSKSLEVEVFIYFILFVVTFLVKVKHISDEQ